MNDHVFSYCRDFITSGKNPQFAVFIKGEWGCGKTFFINELVSRLGDEIVKERLVRISLYGVCSTDEIDRKIYEALHPVLSSNGAKIAGAIFKTVLKLGPSFSFSGDDGSFSFGLGDFSFSQGDVKRIAKDNKIIIVDDLERASLPSETILGYFSNLISDTDNRIIFVGNEEKVNDKDSFTKIKEKTIGMEFCISPDFESALNSFLPDVLTDKALIPIAKKALEEINSIIECNNLRIIRQAIYNFRLLVDCLPSGIDFSSSDLMKTFFVLFIQRSLGIIEANEIKDSISAFFLMNMRLDDFKKEKEAHNNDSFWGFQLWADYESVFSYDTWRAIIFDGQYNKDAIADDYQKHLDRIKAEALTPLYQLLHWTHLSRDDFSSLCGEVHTGFENGDYLEPGEVIHYIQLFDQLIERKLIPMTKAELKKDVDTLLDLDTVHALSLDQWQGMMAMNHYRNYGFSEFKDTWYNGLIEKLKEKSISKSVIELRNSFLEKLNTDENVIGLCHDLENKTGSEPYCNIAVLSCLSDDELFRFAAGISRLGYDDFSETVSCLKSRYGFGTTGFVKKTLLDEYPNICKLVQQFELALANEDVLFNPHVYVLKYFTEELKKLREYLKEKDYTNNSSEIKQQSKYI